MIPFESNGFYLDETFRNVDAAKAAVDSAEFHDCIFRDCTFTEAELKHCRFVGCQFVTCDLSLAQLDGSVVSAVVFEQCRLLGVNWAALNWMAPTLGFAFSFKECALSHGTFIGLALPKLQMIDCTATDVDFREANLSGASFKGSDLAKSLFQQTNLTKADLRSARNYRISPLDNTLTKARFAMPEAMALLYALDIQLTE